MLTERLVFCIKSAAKEFESPETMVAKKVVSLHRAINVGVYLLAALKCQFELINKYLYCIRNTFFHNNGCWDPCILAKIRVIFKSIKNQNRGQQESWVNNINRKVC